MNHKLLKQGPCSFCDTKIVENGKSNNLYKEFYVKFNDGSNAAFAICSNCFNSLDKEKVEKLVSNQIYTWGDEIHKQMAWFINTACHLKLDTFGKTKDEL